MATDSTPEEQTPQERRAAIAKRRAAFIERRGAHRTEEAPAPGVVITKNARGAVTVKVDGQVYIRPRRLEGDEVSGMMPLGDA